MVGGAPFFWQPPVGIISRKALTKTLGIGTPQSPFAPGPQASLIRPCSSTSTETRGWVI